MRKSTATRAVELMTNENPHESLEARNEQIKQHTGLPIAVIENIRRTTVIKKGPEF